MAQNNTKDVAKLYACGLLLVGVGLLVMGYANIRVGTYPIAVSSVVFV